MENCISALRFLISEINFGGRVSDHKDQLIVSSMMEAYYQPTLHKLGGTVEKDYGIPEEAMKSNMVETYI